MRETFVKTSGYSEDFKSSTGSGWGCGYVYIPKEHPILVNVAIATDYCYYLQPNDCPEEITYSAWDVDFDYYVIGFDTAHSYNNPTEHDEQYVISQTNKIKELVDAFTAEQARELAIKEIQRRHDNLISYL
jgi:hypothetical protein